MQETHGRAIHVSLRFFFFFIIIINVCFIKSCCKDRLSAIMMSFIQNGASKVTVINFFINIQTPTTEYSNHSKFYILIIISDNRWEQHYKQTTSAMQSDSFSWAKAAWTIKSTWNPSINKTLINEPPANKRESSANTTSRRGDYNKFGLLHAFLTPQ